jgi:hypothetical protein
MTTFFAGDELAAADLEKLNVTTVAKPIGRLIQQPASQALADNTAVAVTFGTGSTVYDTNSFHSESSNTTRVTPSIAGYYRFSGVVFFETEASPVVASANFRFNGTTNLAAAWRAGTASIGLQAFSGLTQVTIAMNGTTDYVELMALQDSAGADNTNTSVHFSSTLEWEFIRPL